MRRWGASWQSSWRAGAAVGLFYGRHSSRVGALTPRALAQIEALEGELAEQLARVAAAARQRRRGRAPAADGARGARGKRGGAGEAGAASGKEEDEEEGEEEEEDEGGAESVVARQAGLAGGAEADGAPDGRCGARGRHGLAATRRGLQRSSLLRSWGRLCTRRLPMRIAVGLWRLSRLSGHKL